MGEGWERASLGMVESETGPVLLVDVAALVAGGLAVKTGLLKALWLGILAFKKFIIIGVIALAAGFKKLWAWIRGRSTREDTVAASGPPTAPGA